MKILLDLCYHDPPRNVYQRMLDCYQAGDPLYLVELCKTVVGMVHLARHSKGDLLENLVLVSRYRRCVLADCLVEMPIKDNAGAISLTTRVPDLFARQSFKSIKRCRIRLTLWLGY